ncbi:hypothetical protein [Brevibacillus sp. LEMMJ03]|uniref:hypothetical protein n=1 Tax=Brevibacillus sp. LEMMJ03 TaxID=2595056 RepID=UPI0021066969|nr:hypothetical protein [Brevibacillus sp. LEMMJ03]
MFVLQRMMEALDQALSGHGVIRDVILRTEHSLLEDEETREITVYVTATAEEAEQPLATVHLFPLPDGAACEVEAEIAYPGAGEAEAAALLWERARAIVPEVSLTEKRRCLKPGVPAERGVTLDFHFVVEGPETNEANVRCRQALDRFAADLGRLLRL